MRHSSGPAAMNGLVTQMSFGPRHNTAERVHGHKRQRRRSVSNTAKVRWSEPSGSPSAWLGFFGA